MIEFLVLLNAKLCINSLFFRDKFGYMHCNILVSQILLKQFILPKYFENSQVYRITKIYRKLSDHQLKCQINSVSAVASDDLCYLASHPSYFIMRSIFCDTAGRLLTLAYIQETWWTLVNLSNISAEANIADACQYHTHLSLSLAANTISHIADYIAKDKVLQLLIRFL